MRKNLYSVSEINRRRLRASAPAFLLALFCAAAFGQSVAAQTTNPPAPSNRWLLIVDMSRPMQRRADPVLQLAAGLLMSGMNGQMQAGDTIGLWTFDETLHAGDFPLQKWTPDTSRIIAQRTFEFLQAQKYQNDSHFDKVLAEMDRVIKASEFITIILISDGSAEMRGTPFDDKINGSYQTWLKEQQKSQMPFVTLLRARRGHITDYAVNTPPWPLEMPPLPEELLNRNKPPPPPPPAVVPSLSFSGRKPEPAVAPAATNAVVPAGQEIAAKPAPVETASTNESSPAAPRTESPAPPAAPVQSAAVVPVQNTAANTATDSVQNATAPPVQSAAAVSSGKFWNRKNIWNLGLVLVGVVLGWTLAVLFRPRDNRPISLITRSLDREK